MSYKLQIYKLEALAEHGRASMFDMEELHELYSKQEILELEREVDMMPQDGTLETLEKKSKRVDRIIELKQEIGTWQK